MRVGVSGRAGLDPLADEIPVELPEAAAGVIEFIGFGMADRKKCPIQRDGATGSVAASVSIAAATASSPLTNEKHSPSRKNVPGRKAESTCRSIGSALLRGFVFIRHLRLQASTGARLEEALTGNGRSCQNFRN